MCPRLPAQSRSDTLPEWGLGFQGLGGLGGLGGSGLRVSGFGVWGLGFGQECSGLPGLGLGAEGVVGPLMQPALPLKGVGSPERARQF